MKSLLLLSLAFICLLLSGCKDPTAAAEASAPKPPPAGIYSALPHEDGLMLKLALYDEKQIAYFLGDEELITTWTNLGKNQPVDYFIAVRNGVLYSAGTSSEISRLAAEPNFRLIGMSDRGDEPVQEAVIGRTADGTPFRIVLQPLNEEIREILAKEAAEAAQEAS